MKPDMRDLLPKLRQIGFGSWDPLGLSKTWADGEAMADEYDRFLISALGKAVNRGGTDAVCEVLREAEVRMGLVDDGPADCRERAAREILEFACRHAVG
jgi:hypothetical protein